MADTPTVRRLTTIVALDVAGYSARTEADEAKTAAEVTALRRVIEDIAAPRGGRLFNTAGDGFMLEFGSSLGAVEAALALAETCTPKVRVGVHLGDVVVQPNGDLLGHGVNVAARLMARSDPGSALVSADVRRTIRGPLADRLASRGEIQLDKMAERIEAFAVVAPGEQPVVRAAPTGPEPLLAVLPFDNLSDDREMQFFSDGVSEEIIQRLARGARMKVVGRTSSFQFRGADKNARKVAGELACTHILDGSIRRSAGRVRISAHLVDTGSQTTLWSDRYDRGLEDIFAVQDEIAEHIAGALDRTFTSFSTKAVDPAVYDLYLRASPASYAPDELQTCVGLLEVAVQRAPHFAEAWGRLAFLRAFSRFYRPFRERAAIAALVTREAERALALDAENANALVARVFLLPPYGSFEGTSAMMERLRRASDGEALGYAGWLARNLGWLRVSVRDTEHAHRLDLLNPMLANMLGLARMAAGHVAEAATLFEELLARVPTMTFPIPNLLRAKAFLGEWSAVDPLLERLRQYPLREFQDGIAFIEAKRDPTPERVGAIRDALTDHCARTGSVDVARLVYAAHLGLVDDAYRVAAHARLGPTGSADDLMGPDGYRPALLFHASMPELRNDPRFVPLCARLGLVDFWLTSGQWPDCADEVPYDFRAECAKARNVPREAFGF